MTKTKRTKASKKPAAKEVAPGKEPGHERTADLPWNDTKAQVLEALRKLGKPVSSAEAAKVANLRPYHIRHYGYAAVAGKLVKMTKSGQGFLFEITPAGVKALAEYKKGSKAK
jgi:hypothetical protein